MDEWLILGLDPSLSRTGFSLMHVYPSMHPTSINEPNSEHKWTECQWLAAGSIKPEVTSDPVWIRGKAMSLYLRDLTTHHSDNIIAESLSSYMNQLAPTKNLGLIISMEYPTPRNDFLVALNRIIHLIMFENNFWERFSSVRVLTTNASTLRSLMGLIKRGNNKGENIACAYTFIDREKFPSLDSDACDAVLLTMMARHTASIFMGAIQEVPQKFLNSLCNSTKEVKGKGTRTRIITKGILHRPEYWYPYTRKSFVVCIKDASSKKSRLERQTYQI